MMRLSIKWKLSFALILSGLILILVYIWIAKRVFESDKISYVFDSQSSKLSSQKREIEQRFEKSLLTSRSIIATYDPNKGVLNSAGDQIFQEEKSILALELWNETDRQVVFHVEKEAGVLPSANSDPGTLEVGKLQILPLSTKNFMILLKYPQLESSKILKVRAVVQFADILPVGETHQVLMLFKGDQFIVDSNGHDKIDPIFTNLSSDMEAQSGDKTMMWGQSPHRYLVSSAKVGVGDFRVVAVTPEKVALGALGTLFTRSLVFLLFSVFGLIIVSLLLARGLTNNLQRLTQVALKIGQGEFGTVAEVKSQDEMGILAKALAKMSFEIQRLLMETRDKTRMEEELKTASLVQESLQPKKSDFKINEIDISGMVMTSTECGGDWWHYFTKGDDLYIAIADATGHGTPAALITAAARAVFSRLEEEELSLNQMITSWSRAVRSCSNERIFMTGILMKIQTTTGVAHYVSAGHEPPFWLKPGSDGAFHFESLDMNKNKSLGEETSQFLAEQEFVLGKDEALLLYTDGLFSVAQGDKMLSEKRFGRQLAATAGSAKSARHIMNSALSIFEDHRKDAALPDDITLVAVRRRSDD